MKKCLIFGATGWLGKATIAKIIDDYPQNELTLISSKSKKIEYKNKLYEVGSFNDFLNIKNNTFDYFYCYAFLTGNNIESKGKEHFLNETNKIIDATSTFLSQNTIKKGLLSSSGAVYWSETNKENLYSIQKKRQEIEFLKSFENNQSLYHIARIFSVIARDYNVEFNYAFNSFVSQAKKNKKIVITSKKKVERSYLIFENMIDYFQKSKESKIYDAANFDIDLVELAEIISEIFDCNIEYPKSYNNSSQKDLYKSKDKSFRDNFKEKKGLKQEILKVINQTKEHPMKVLN